MRLALLTLLLVVAVSGGFFSRIKEKTKEVFSNGHHFAQKLKNATKIGFQKFLMKTGLMKIRDKFRKVRDKALKLLQLTPEMLKSLKERLKKMTLFKRDKVQANGDTVTEINAKTKVDKVLYQADILLTP
ncbi:unnamed protein product [Haemonchus placei]|uniref:Uncharacterized protein n=1 Tax=Haemonchus placei TaxID=6290 RepID=A0A0N4VY56_HAEPC|nr:unnamed protein product [Haemonchus placei]